MSADSIMLTEREDDVIRLILQGHTNRQIACALSIAEHTVERHLGNIYRKLGVTNRTSAALRFMEMSGTGNPS